jgi:hypothetical protein
MFEHSMEAGQPHFRMKGVKIGAAVLILLLGQIEASVTLWR